jgi:hypothetical protein
MRRSTFKPHWRQITENRFIAFLEPMPVRQSWNRLSRLNRKPSINTHRIPATARGYFVLAASQRPSPSSPPELPIAGEGEPELRGVGAPQEKGGGVFQAEHIEFERIEMPAKIRQPAGDDHMTATERAQQAGRAACGRRGGGEGIAWQCDVL